MANIFKDDAEIAALVRAFEMCELNPAGFKHYQHLAVALWHIANFPFAEASEKMTSGIKKLAAAYGKSGYHETITVFWLDLVHEFYLSVDSSDSISRLANRLVAQYEKDAIYEFYSRELLDSAEAKSKWVAPDAQPLTMVECV
jgi:hypothetical protein